MNENKINKKLAEQLRKNPIMREVMNQAGSENRPHRTEEYSSYSEITELAKSAGMIGNRYDNPELLQSLIATLEHVGLIEIEEFDKETGYLRAKWFLPHSIN